MSESARRRINRSTARRPRTGVDPLDVLNDDLLRCRPAPDLTRRIMGRLGYMRVPSRVARRRRIARLASRCAFIALAGVAVSLGVKAHQASPNARTPLPITMPAAVSRDFHDHQRRFGTMLRLIQEMPAANQYPTPGPMSAPLWDDSTPVDPQEPDRPDVDEEVNRSAIAPVRWV